MIYDFLYENLNFLRLYENPNFLYENLKIFSSKNLNDFLNES